MNPQHCVKVCNSLLRGERSAMETYERAVAAYKSGTSRPEITRIFEEHREAVVALSENVRSMGGSPDLEDGAWGTFAQPIREISPHSELSPVLTSLQTGEKIGQSDYEAALRDDEVMPRCKDLIRSRLLPRIKEHIRTLDHLQHAA